MKFKKYEQSAAIGAVFAWLVFTYLSSIARGTVNFADSNDLLLAGLSRGLAHPPGYPLLVWLLWLAFTCLPHLPPVTVAGGVTAILMAANGALLVWLLLLCLDKLHLTGRWRLMVAMGLGLLWATFPLNWVLGTVVEVMPLSLLLAETVWIIGLTSQGGRVSLFLIGLVAGLACWYHPLVIPIVGLAVGTTLWHHRFQEWWWLAAGMALATVITGGLYLGLTGTGYSWEVPQTITGWWQFWSRQIYTSSGSAIEQFSSDHNWGRMMMSAWFWLKWWWLDQHGLVWSGLSIIGVIWFLKQRHMWWAAGGIILAGGYSLGLGAYVRSPALYGVSETAVWWGEALRERMFYLLPSIMLILAGVSLVVLLNRCWHQRWTWLLALVVLAAGGYQTNWQRTHRALSDVNSSEVYARAVLTTLPTEGVLMVNSDEVFNFLYAQLVLGVNPGIEIVPTSIPLMINHQAIKQPARDSRVGLAETVAKYVAAGRRVFVYGMDAEVLAYLGVEGNPFYAVPAGYSVEITKNPPTTFGAADYGISIQLGSIKTAAADRWFRGFRTHVATRHSELAYYYARMGFLDQAKEHQHFARELVYSPQSEQLLDEVVNVGWQRFQESGSYAAYLPRAASEWWRLGSEAELRADRSSAEYYYSRACLLDPNNQEWQTHLSTLATKSRPD